MLARRLHRSDDRTPSLCLCLSWYRYRDDNPVSCIGRAEIAWHQNPRELAKLVVLLLEGSNSLILIHGHKSYAAMVLKAVLLLAARQLG